MAVNKDPILKRCRSLQLDPSHMGIYKESNRKPQQSFKKMSEYGLQLREKQRAKLSTEFRKDSSEQHSRRLHQRRVSQVKTFLSC